MERRRRTGCRTQERSARLSAAPLRKENPIAIGADLPVSLALVAEEAPEGMKGRLVAFSGFLWFIGIIVTEILKAIVGPLGALGGRILYAHLLLVAVVVLVLRLGLPESREWAAAQRAKAAGDDEIRFSDIPQASLSVP